MIAPASSADSGGAQSGRRLVEVRARGRLRAVDAVAPLDDVQVQLEDAPLAQLGLEPARDDQLAQLAHGFFDGDR